MHIISLFLFGKQSPHPKMEANQNGFVEAIVTNLHILPSCNT